MASSISGNVSVSSVSKFWEVSQGPQAAFSFLQLERDEATHPGQAPHKNEKPYAEPG